MFEYIQHFLFISFLYPFIELLFAQQNNLLKQSKEELTGMSIKLFTMYTDFIYNWNIFYKEKYENDELFREAMDIIINHYTQFHSFIYGYQLEPDEPDWYNISVLNNMINTVNKNIEYTLDEKYEIYEKYNKPVQETTMIEYNNIINNMNKNDLISVLITIKQDDKYYIQVNTCTNMNLKFTPSTVRFLSIEYEDPLLKEKIPLTINENMFYENNEILSSAFIKRYLEYNPTNVTYNHNYKIHIMDNDINMITLTSKDYILLHKDKYEIISNK
jgi:hypothetical protein